MFVPDELSDIAISMNAQGCAVYAFLHVYVLAT